MRIAYTIGIIVLFGCVVRAQSAAEKTALDLCLANAPGSSTDGLVRVFYTPKIADERDAIVFINAVRVSAEVRWISRCNGVSGIVLRGTNDQLGITEWLIQQVYGSDTTGNSQPQYVIANSPTGVIRTFHLQRTTNQQGQAEMVNMLRTATELQRVAQIYIGMTVIVRGEPEKVALAEWLVNELDVAPQPFARERVTENKWVPVVRIFPLPQVQSTQALAELVNLTLKMTELQRVARFTGAGMKTVVAGGPGDNIALADWLIGQLQNPNGSAGAGSSRALGNSGESVKLFYRPGSTDPQELASMVKAITDAASVQRVGFYTPSRVIAVRGTADQIAKAAKVIGGE